MLYPNSPNPFNPTTELRFAVGQPGQVQLAVYNVRGNLIRRLVNEYLTAGVRQIVWNGTDGRGAPVGSGTYLVRLTTDRPERAVRKIVLLK